MNLNARRHDALRGKSEGEESMKFIHDIRWLLAEMFLSWALSVAPDGSEKADLAETLMPFFSRQLSRTMAELKARR